jgi:hypothetical protein
LRIFPVFPVLLVLLLVLLVLLVPLVPLAALAAAPLLADWFKAGNRVAEVLPTVVVPPP